MSGLGKRKKTSSLKRRLNAWSIAMADEDLATGNRRQHCFPLLAVAGSRRWATGAPLLW
jgi:hypothetical protein